MKRTLLFLFVVVLGSLAMQGSAPSTTLIAWGDAQDPVGSVGLANFISVALANNVNSATETTTATANINVYKVDCGTCPTNGDLIFYGQFQFQAHTNAATLQLLEDFKRWRAEQLKARQ